MKLKGAMDPVMNHETAENTTVMHGQVLYIPAESNDSTFAKQYENCAWLNVWSSSYI